MMHFWVLFMLFTHNPYYKAKLMALIYRPVTRLLPDLGLAPPRLAARPE